MRKFHRYSAAVLRDQRWKFLRREALDRDNWACVQCGTSAGLECDHILSVRTRPELAFDLSNLQILCRRCHSAKTRIELGFTPVSKRREAWNKLLQPHINKGKKYA